MDYKRSFFTLVGAILLYCFYSFVETKKNEATTISKSVDTKESTPVAVQPEQIQQSAEPVAELKKPEKAASVKSAAKRKKNSVAVSRRENFKGHGKLAEFEYEPGKFYYSDGKIVEYRKVIQKVDKLEERNLESEFSKLFNEN